MANNNHVHIITMGGTIDKDYPRLTSGYAFEFGEEAAASRILQTHPNLGLTYDITSICKKDSQEVDDSDREKLMIEILRVVGKTNTDTTPMQKRIVVTHGTDTMIDTAKYVQEKLGIPAGNVQISIAFTGATKPERFVDSDAAFNLGSAIAVTAHQNDGVSVLICMNGNVAPADKCSRLENGVFLEMDDK
jgi:L-asparaginase